MWWYMGMRKPQNTVWLSFEFQKAFLDFLGTRKTRIAEVVGIVEMLCQRDVRADSLNVLGTVTSYSLYTVVLSSIWI